MDGQRGGGGRGGGGGGYNNNNNLFFTVSQLGYDIPIHCLLYFPFGPAHEMRALFVLRKLLQTHMCSHPVGLDVWFLVGPFAYFPTSCVQTAKALVRLRRCHNLMSWLICFLNWKLWTNPHTLICLSKKVFSFVLNCYTVQCL